MKTTRVVAGVGAAILVGIATVLLLFVRSKMDGELYRAVATSRTDSGEAIARGEYLAAAGNCVSCHSRSGGAPFSGGRPFTTAFGTIYSSNITPDVETGIGKWTMTDLRRAMFEGIAAGGYRLFPAFPYTSFTKVSPQDVDAIYAYLRTLTPVRYSPPANGIVFRQRWGLSLWNALFFNAGRFEPDSKQSAEWNRGAYLVEGLGHCGACHSPRNAFMAEISSEAYAGGQLQAAVTAGVTRRWSGVNLTTAKTGLAAWSLRQLEQYLKSGFSTRAGAFGPMNEVIVNSLRNLRDEDIHAIASYLKSLPPKGTSHANVAADAARTGAAIYKEHCEECHLVSGRGGMLSGPPLAGSAVVQADDPASLINTILYGPEAPKEISFGFWETMKFYNDVLTDADIASICNFVRSSWGNAAPAVTARDAAGQR
jgi:mono/diheme cytochrome c family protein